MKQTAMPIDSRTTSSSIDTYLARGLRRASATHQGVNANVAVKRARRYESGVTRAPLDVKTPLTAGVQLVHNLHTNVIVYKYLP